MSQQQQQQQRKVLFVCGFNPTGSSWNPHYNALRAYFDATPGAAVDYYSYASTERPESVYAGLCVALKKTKYDAVVGHGLGCTLLAQYFTNHQKALAALAAVVMCMPLITTDNKLHAAALGVPFFEFVPIPLMLFDALFDKNFWTYERYAESFDDVRKKIGCNSGSGMRFENPFGRLAEQKRRGACESETESESDSESDHEEQELERASKWAKQQPRKAESNVRTCGREREHEHESEREREHEHEREQEREHEREQEQEHEREREHACCAAAKREPKREPKRERARACWRKRPREREREDELKPCALRDAMTVFCTHQIKFAYTTWIPELDLRLLGAPNVHVIYATEDAMAPIDPCTLARVRNLRCVTGTHVAFNACGSSRAFFAALGAAMAAATTSSTTPKK